MQNLSATFYHFAIFQDRVGPADLAEYRHILYLFTFIFSEVTEQQLNERRNNSANIRFWESLGGLWQQSLRNKDKPTSWE